MDKQVTIAAINDYPLIREGVSHVIENLTNTHFSGFYERAEFVNSDKNGSFDILLFNSINPLFNEISTLHRILSAHPQIKILALLDYNDEKYFRKLMEAGVAGFVVKSVEASELEYAIRILSTHSTYYSHKLSTHIFEKIFTRSPRQTQVKSYECLNLTNRELEILYLICQEFTNEEIAGKLYISPRTVGGHRNSLMNKTGSRNTAGIVKFAYENNLFKEGYELIMENNS